MYKILDLIEDKAMEALDIFDVLASASRGASFGKFEHEHKIRSEERFNYQLDRDKRRRLQKYIHKLKSEGLLAENSSGKTILSPSGKRKLVLMKNKKIIDSKTYKKESGDRVIIITYDIPNLFNKERDILRGILKELGLEIIHKSVWVGKVKIPKQFITALQMLGILDFVEILEVTKTGSLKSHSE